MNWKEILTEKVVKKIARVVYDEVIFKMAEAYVQKTDNTWDDQVLKFLDDFVDDMLADGE